MSQKKVGGQKPYPFTKEGVYFPGKAGLYTPVSTEPPTTTGRIINGVLVLDPKPKIDE